MLLFFFTAGAGWLYWNAPSIESIRPSIESYLQEELQLDALRLGNISWQWSDFLWLEVDQLDFSSDRHGIAFNKGSASVKIPLFSLFNGDMTPSEIRLRHGTLHVVINNSSPPILPPKLILEATDINWSILSSQASDDWQGKLSSVNLTLHAVNQTLKATSPELNLSAQWAKDGLPQKLTLNCNNTHWLPSAIRQYFNGSAQANITLLRHDKYTWNMQLSLDSPQTMSVHLPQSDHAYLFNRITTKLQINFKPTSDTLSLEHINIRDLQWSLADNHAITQGQWRNGILQLNAKSDRLAMPLVWSWLKPFGSDDWHHWLNLMQQGSAQQAHANISLPWPNPLQSWPSQEDWQAMQYRIQAQLKGIDIALGISNGSLTQTQASVDLNQKGLALQIKDTVLPKGLGHSTSTLYIPWDTLDLHIKGTSNADVKRLLQWVNPSSDMSDWQWNKARANSHFKLIWNPSDALPKSASFSLQPDGIWNVHIFELALQLSQGEVQWDQDTGLSLNNMRLSSPFMQGTFSLQAAAFKKTWRITSLEAHGISQLAPLTAHFQLPISHASGSISSKLSYNGQWSGSLDMQQAGWEHLLGSHKKIGEAFALQYQAQLDTQGKHPVIQINKLTSTGHHITLHDGSGSISEIGLKAQFNGLHTPSFSGSLNIDVPFGQGEAWSMDAKASYLNRNALPDTLDHPEKLMNKTWRLRADIDRFDWDDAQMSGVHINLSSAKNSLGSLEAAQIHTAQMDILDVGARFTLPGQGRVELRRLSAQFEKQKLTMSATLSPEADGGMGWKGFAELHGNFGHMMNKGGLSKRFLDGDSRILFSGQGLILKDQPWWQGLNGRLRMRVDQGRVLEGGTLTTLLSAINLNKLPALLFGQRKDLSGPGIMYERLQMEAIIQNQDIRIRNVAMRSSAFDLVGQGNINIETDMIDLYLIAKPLQNLDALLSKIPLLRDILGGRSHSLIRKVYHLHGPFADAEVKSVKPEAAGLASPGIIERLFSLPDTWFGSNQPNKQLQAKP